MREHSSRPHTPTLVVAICALLVSLGGTGYAVSALPHHSVGKAQLQKNAVTSKAVANGSLESKDFGAGQLPQGAPGPSGPPGVQGSPGAKGNTGNTGATGPSNVYVAAAGSFVSITALTGGTEDVVRTLSLPAGTYYATTSIYAENESATLVADIRCGLKTSGTETAPGLSSAFVPLAPHSGNNGYRELFDLNAAVTLTTAGSVTLTCARFAPSDLASVGASITAIKTGSITVAP